MGGCFRYDIDIYVEILENIQNLHYTDEDQNSETIDYGYQVMEKILIWFEKKKNMCIYIVVFLNIGNKEAKLTLREYILYIYVYICMYIWYINFDWYTWWAEGLWSNLKKFSFAFPSG